MPIQVFNTELDYLKGCGFITRSYSIIKLTSRGVKITEIFFKKFIEYIKNNYTKELEDYINIFDLYRKQSSTLISQIYFHLQKNSDLKKAFEEYLTHIDVLDNIESYENNKFSLDRLIDEIFNNMHQVNILFENQFRHKIFCPPLNSQSSLNKAIKGKTINFTELVAIVATIIDCICNQAIDQVLISKPNGSINKIKAFLDLKNIRYDIDTIDKLRTLHSIRSKLSPIHETGPEIIFYLNKINIDFPIKNCNDAAYKILYNFNICLLEMKKWFK